MTVSSASSSSSSSNSSNSSGSSSTITTSGNSLSSTIDWDKLIQAAVQAKLAPATVISKKITANQTKITAYQKLQTDLSKLATDLTALSKSIINPLATNAFAARSATISATGNISADAALSMTIANGAATGDHTLQITQLATAQKIAGTTQSSQTAALGLSGTFSIGLAGGSSASISITSGMNLQDVADAINGQTSTTNVQASIVQVSSGSFELVLTGTQDAADITYSSTSGDDILNKLGVTDSSGAFSNVLQASQAAKFTLDGIALTRNTNDISDVLSGVTFSLLQPTPSGSTINISIGANTDQITSALQDFAKDYNAFRDDVIAQQATNSDGTAASSAVLFGDSTMRDIMTRIEQVLGTSVGGLTMSDLGLSFNEQNELDLDAGVLSSVLTTNLSGVTALLSAQTTTSSSQLTVANINNAPPSFTLDIQVDSSGKLTGASVNGDSSLFSVDDMGNIIGSANSIYAGMAFNYTGTTSQSITITSTLGLAAQIRQIADDASRQVAADGSGNSGSLQTQIDSLTTQDTSLQQNVNDIQSAAATFQNQLLVQYAKYQAAIQQANTTLNYLSALLNAKSNN
jgi:flagellar hook-associated protein 2